VSGPIKLAAGVSWPLQLATETLLIVGKRGSGKSSTATRIAEQLIRARVRVCVIDPVDVWWGMKAGANGRRDGGLSVVVFGGSHRDLPLEPSGGVVVADAIVDQRINAVISIRGWSNRDKARFVADFAERLYNRNREALHLVCEEAHEVMPQEPYKGEEEMLGRMLRLQKLGRSSGIGLTSVTQRPASLNKNATTQAEILIAHRVLGPQDVDAVKGWIKYHDDVGKTAEVLSGLATLKTGEAWVWAPDFPNDEPLGLRRVQVLKPETFDSRATVVAGKKRSEPRSLASVDLAALREKMQESIARAAADDPRELRLALGLEKTAHAQTTRQLALEIRAKERAIAERPAPAPPRPTLKGTHVRRLERAAAKLDAAASVAQTTAEAILAAVRSGRSLPETPSGARPETAPDGRRAAPEPAGRVERGGNGSAGAYGRRLAVGPGSAKPAGAGKQAPLRTDGELSLRPESAGGSAISGGEQAMLDALAMLDHRMISVDRNVLASWLGVHPNGGRFNRSLKRLRALGFVTADGSPELTERGRVAAHLPRETGIEGLLDAAPETRAIVDALRDAPPVIGYSRDQLGEKLGVHPNGGRFNRALRRLRKMGVVPKRGGIVLTESANR